MWIHVTRLASGTSRLEGILEHEAEHDVSGGLYGTDPLAATVPCTGQGALARASSSAISMRHRAEYGGDPPRMKDDELPVFWACGVTPQSVLLNAKPPISITHRPGHMLVTDLKNAELAVF